MKKSYRIIKAHRNTLLFVLLTILITSCANGCGSGSAINLNKSEYSTDLYNVPLVQDETQKPRSTNDKTSGVGISYDVEGKSVIKQSIDGIDMAIDSSLDTLAKYSTEVIRGITRRVSFVGINGLAWTKTDVEITEALKGELQQGDIISIYLLGGYIPLAEYLTYKNESRFTKLSDIEIENTLLQFVVEKEALPIIDEDLVYFLDMTPAYAPLPSGAYERVCGKDAQFKVSSDGKTLTREPLNSYDKTFKLQYVKSFLSY